MLTGYTAMFSLAQELLHEWVDIPVDIQQQKHAVIPFVLDLANGL